MFDSDSNSYPPKSDSHCLTDFQNKLSMLISFPTNISELIVDVIQSPLDSNRDKKYVAGVCLC